MAEVTLNKILTPLTSEGYDDKDLKLIPSFDVISQFNPEEDNIEFSIYNENNILEYINYSYKDFTITLDYNTKKNSVSTINVNPEEDLIKEGYSQGTYTAIYNFLRPQISSSQSNPFYIKQISSDRTEIRIANNNISNEELEKLTNEFKSNLNSSAYFEDFYINFGNNNVFIANNILIDTTSDQYTVLIKLYEPLESQFNIKDTLWVVIQTAEEVSYQVNFAPVVIPPPPAKKLKGPNFNLKSKDVVNNSTVYVNNNELNNTILTSSYNELKGILNKKGITVNIDYSDFNNFIYFSSAEQRVRNFYYKLSLIQSYDDEISELESTSNSNISASIVLLENSKTQIIKNFDGYEEYQYYSSGSSDIYPKSNASVPYTLASTGSAEALAWLEDQATNSGSTYDLENVDRIVNSLPSYVQDDTRNEPLFLFMDMVGQHFDNIWVYTKDLSNRFDADNRLDYGISKDIVADAIKGMGIQLYQNNFTSDNLFSSLTGINPGGGLLVPTGSEVIETYISASNGPTILDNVNKEIYKRIYHNLPYLLKTKGTIEGIRALINIYGIPDTILRISEFGGKDKDNSNDWDYFQNIFNYYTYISESSTTDRINTGFRLESDWGSNTPKEILFRFKPETPTSNNEQNFRTVCKITNSGESVNAYLTLSRTGSWDASGSYSGSITSQSRNYAELAYWSNGTKVTNVNAPFYDGNWWGVSINSGSSEFTLKAANKIYNGNEGFKIGYTTSSTNSDSSLDWNNSTEIFLPSKDGSSATTLDSNDYYGLTGSYQELRFYNVSLSENTFYDFVMNPHSIEGSNYSSSAENLAFRAPLGSELVDTGSGTYNSIHPKITGSYVTQSFSNTTSTYTIGSSVTLPSQTEIYYYDQPAVGIKNRISEKIRTQPHSFPSGSTLSPLRSIQQTYLTPESGSYTKDINLVEIAFSPQNEINDDINSSFGYFNIGDYIGDPRQISESVTSYPELDKLRDSYFSKYYTNYNWNDYIRLIKYFDNSLFKMIKDFVPAKSSLATGVVIKQHLLERNKQRPAQVESSQHEYSGSVYASSSIGNIIGGEAGAFTNLNQSPANNSLVSLTGANAYVVRRDIGTLTVINSFGGSIGNYGVSGSEGGFIIDDGGSGGQVRYPFKNTSDIPIQFDFSLEGEVFINDIDEGELHIFSDKRFTTSSFRFMDKRKAGAIFSASLGNVSVGGTINVEKKNLTILPGESLSIAISDNDAESPDEQIGGCKVVFSQSTLHNNPAYNSQIWNEIVQTISGSTTLVHSSQNEFYDGELSGSKLLVTNGELGNIPTGSQIEYSNIYIQSSNYGTRIFTNPDNFDYYLGLWAATNEFDLARSVFVLRDNNNVIEIVFGTSLQGGVPNFIDTLNSASQGSTFTLTVTDAGTLTPGQGGVAGAQPVGVPYTFTISNTTYNDNLAANPGAFAILRVALEGVNPNPSSYLFNVVGGAQNGVLVQGVDIIGRIIDTPLSAQKELENLAYNYNNVTNSRLSSIYQDIDYSNGIIPINQSLIETNSALKAPIQDSNYYNRGWINGRYKGSKISSTDFNIPYQN